MKFVLSCTAVLLIGVGVAAAQTPSAGDAEFTMKATVGNQFEIEEAKLAVDRATNPRLKAFARRMLKDHGDALTKLTAAEKRGGVEVVPLKLDVPHQAMLDNLRGYNGADFDRIYTADQVAAHAETVALLSDYQQNGRNPDLKSWAKQSLPIVKGHRAVIDAM